jgi:hypothetical protein
VTIVAGRGEDIQKVVAQTVATPPAAIERLKAVLGSK